MNEEYFNVTFDVSAHHKSFMDSADDYDPKPKPVGYYMAPLTPPTGEIFELKTVHISHKVACRVINLLKSFQSQFGPDRPDDDEDEAEVWDEIEEVCDKLKKEVKVDGFR